MEPIKLCLSNFLSYRDETIDLEGVTCAALTGENGSGKSSFVDAILWALFGQGSRGKDLDSYVAHGEGECRVELHFRLNGNLYRIVRGRSHQRSKSTLEFFVLDGSDWRALSAKTIAETQALIEQTLRMDYRTFTTSSVILQGQADSFTANITDSERKDVLGRILGLDMWDRMRELVRSKIHAVRSSILSLEAQQERFKATVDQGAALEGKKTELTGQLIDAERDVAVLTSGVTDIEVKLRQRPTLEQSLVETKQATQKANDEQSGVQTRRAQIQQQIGQCEAQITESQAIISRKVEIEEAASTEPGKAAAVAELDRKAEEHTKLSEKIANIERRKAALDADKATRLAKLEAELCAINRREQIKQQINQYKTQIEVARETLQLKDEVEQAIMGESKLMLEIAEHERKEQEHTRLSREAERLSVLAMQFEVQRDANINQLDATIKMYQSQADVLGEVPCGTDQQDVCPLLANAREAAEQITVLTEKRDGWKIFVNPHVADKLMVVDEIERLGYGPEAHRAAKLALIECQKMTSLKPRIDAAEQRVAELEKLIAGLEIELASLADRERVINEQLTDVRAEVNPFDESYAQAQAEQVALGYDQALHRIAKADLAETQKVAQLKPQLEAAEQRVSELNGRINELQQEMADLAERELLLEKQLTELTEKEQLTVAEIKALTPLAAELEQKQQELSKTRQREAELRTELGRVEQQLTAVVEAQAELAKIETDTKELRQRLNVLETLDQACGKKAGVPALIVENAVPELERLANEMLSRMAGGRLQVRLDTQAETKAGTMQEVLRITVLDSGEERPYQTYSGAERFLVDLALRVALSKFLSHRAGAEIRLFVLDEGIGCADATNRQAILDAILAVSDEFGKTLVVTHLDELKEAFPQRIEVTKDNNGSKVRVA